MKKGLLLIAIIFAVIAAKAQMSENEELEQSIVAGVVQLDVNDIDQEGMNHINNYVIEQQKSRGFLLGAFSALMALVDFNTIKSVVRKTSVVFSERSIKKRNWNNLMKNECIYTESINYVNSLNDFYSQGSFNGPLDPENLKFNGFTLYSQNNGEDVLKFYCHIATDEEGLDYIFNHSKFRLVVDSVYFYPYNCHLPNMLANGIYVKKGKEYVRNTKFSFEDRENLMVEIQFDFTSSWYNEAMILAKDVELGSFNVQIPIDKSQIVDSVYVYKRGMPDVEPINITGDCFLVPRSYMPLSGGVSRWGTGEYNVKATVSESCSLTKQFKKKWLKDYRRIKKMRRNKDKVETYFVDSYKQNGNKVEKTTIETISKKEK